MTYPDPLMIDQWGEPLVIRCAVQGCPMEIDLHGETGYREHADLGFCHTHWFMLPREVRERIRASGDARAGIEWHQENGGGK